MDCLIMVENNTIDFTIINRFIKQRYLIVYYLLKNRTCIKLTLESII